VLFPAQESDGLQQLGDALPPPFCVFTVEEEGELDVLPNGGVGKKIEVLENEAVQQRAIFRDTAPPSSEDVPPDEIRRSLAELTEGKEGIMGGARAPATVPPGR
jgi:hypothetical protein